MYAEGMCLGPGQHLLSVWLTESEGVFALLSSLTHLFLTTLPHRGGETVSS